MNVCSTDYCIFWSPSHLGRRSRIFFHLLFVECQVDSEVVFTQDNGMLSKLVLPVYRAIVAEIHPTCRIHVHILIIQSKANDLLYNRKSLLLLWKVPVSLLLCTQDKYDETIARVN